MDKSKNHHSKFRDIHSLPTKKKLEEIQPFYAWRLKQALATELFLLQLLWICNLVSFYHNKN